MRVFSWIGGIVLVAVISTATAATLRAHNETAHALVAAKPPVAAIGIAYAGDPPLENHRLRPSPDPGPLTWSSCLANVAAANASRLAQQGWVPPYHTNGPTLDLGCRLGSQAGENIGYWTGGINDGQLNTMFMNSPEHHANIMGPYHYVATAWAVAANGYGYIAVEFS